MVKFVRPINSIIAASLSALLISPPLFAQSTPQGGSIGMTNPYTGEPVESDYPDGYKPIGNMDVIGGLGAPTAESLLFQADYALKLGNYEVAIALLKKSLAENDDDADTHFMYAQALEKKLRGQEKKDPKLFNKVVKEYLMVMRSERGIEKGLYFHGFATPYGRSFGDEGRELMAAQRLYKLTGMVPRIGQSDKKYLSLVLKPVTTEVEGKILNHKAPEKPVKLADDRADVEEEGPTKPAKKPKKQQRPPVNDLD
jgi:hypothetical protein